MFWGKLTSDLELLWKVACGRYVQYESSHYLPDTMSWILLQFHVFKLRQVVVQNRTLSSGGSGRDYIRKKKK